MGKLSTHQRRARNFVQRAQWDSALAEMRQAMNSDPNNPSTHNQMGDLYLRKNEVDNACEHFEKAIDLYSQLGLHNNAVALCRKVMRLAPSRVDVRYSLARLRFEQGLRADGVAAFNDYLDNVATGGEEAMGVLEERCRSLVADFLDAAPVGKILEKLESVHAFACAFEIVQRMAQRAADTGDDAAAVKYTEKMRSLRVLVEGSGGGDIHSEALAPPYVESQHRDDIASAWPPEIVIDAGEIATAAPPEIVIDSAELAAAQPAPSAPENASAGDVIAPPEALAAGNESAASSLDDLLQDFDASGGAGEGAQAGPTAPADPPRSGTWSFGPAAQTPASQVPTVEPPTSTPELEATDSVGVPEYELPEASLDDFAQMLENEERAAAPQEPEPLATTPESQPQPWPEATPPLIDPGFALGAAASSPAPPEAAAQAPSPQAPSPAQGQPLPAPQQGHQPDASAPRSIELGEPVWIPDPGADPTAMPDQQQGQMHQLEDVIETFRDQMAKALGDDAAARYDLGVAYYEMGLYNEALREFDAAARDERYREQCLEMMAACLAMQGRHSEIVDMLSPVVSASEPNVGLGLRYSMGVAYEALGQREEARHHFVQIAQIDSTYRDVQARLMRY